jgi:hypothetical protein
MWFIGRDVTELALRPNVVVKYLNKQLTTIILCKLQNADRWMVDGPLAMFINKDGLLMHKGPSGTADKSSNFGLHIEYEFVAFQQLFQKHSQMVNYGNRIGPICC